MTIDKASPYAACTIDHTGCDHMSRDIELIERIAAAGSKGPTEVSYLYAGAAPMPNASLSGKEMRLFGHWSKHRLADGVFLPLVCYVPTGSDYTTVPLYALSTTATEGE